MSDAKVALNAIQTENRNPRSINIDKVTTAELCRIVNAEDATVPGVVGRCIETIAEAIDALAERVRNGGRVFSIGAGTSGRLAVLDASEIPPTYSAPSGQFVGLIAGGDVALRSAVEGAEDSPEAAVTDLEACQLSGECDALIGIAASGRTPYVLGGLAFAKAKGCTTVGVACSAPSAMSQSGHVDFMINAVTGPEVVTGSTRMKAGTATKLVLNMISTGIMIRTGKTYGNIMIDVRPSNAKLRERARRMLREVCKEKCPVNDDALDGVLAECSGSVKLAAVAISFDTSVDDAKTRLQATDGVLVRALDAVTSSSKESTKKRYYLCVDGGGTKCSATITSHEGSNSGGLDAEGCAGPCNATEVGIDGAVMQIDLATQRAIEAHSDSDIVFSAAWVAVAGGDREGLRSNLHKALLSRLPLAPGAQLRMTNDIGLVATAAFHDYRKSQIKPVDTVVVLVAGTGSIAMAYQRKDNAVVQVGRSGGWGALLGDDGSGFDVGRQAIRHALGNIEADVKLDNTSNGPRRCESSSLDMLTRVVLQCCGPSGDVALRDLLSRILLPNPNNIQGTAETKRMIASFARPVIEAWQSDDDARVIIENAQRSLKKLVQNLLNKGVAAEDSDLVLAGGLMASDTFATEFKNLLVRCGIRFRAVSTNRPSGWAGACYLADTDVDAPRP